MAACAIEPSRPPSVQIKLSVDRFNRFQGLTGVFGNREIPTLTVYQAASVRLTFFKKAAR
jgi:hypothetical protein